MKVVYPDYQNSAVFRKQLIPVEHPAEKPYPFPEGDGGLNLIAYLSRKGTEGAPAFVSGNLLFTSIWDPRGEADRKACRFLADVPTRPGLRYVSLFPVTNAQGTNDRLADEAAELHFYRNGREIELEWQADGRLWTPADVTEEFRGDGLKLLQKTAILRCRNADVLGAELHFEGNWQDLEVEIVGRFFRTGELTQAADGTLAGKITEESPDFHFFYSPWEGRTPPSTAVGSIYAFASDLELSDSEYPGTEYQTYRLRGKLRDGSLQLFLAAGFQKEEVEAALNHARTAGKGFLREAREKFEDFFRTNVPAFSCSDKKLERVYAEFQATSYLSCYELYYEPFHYRINCPGGKTFAAWQMQFYHDSIFSSRAQLWLNDASRCMDDLLQMVDVQYIHCSPRLGLPLAGQSDCMPLVFNMLPQAAWEMFRRTDDKAFLEKLFDHFLDYDRKKCRPRSPDSPYDEKYEEFPPFSWLFPGHHFDCDGDWLVESQLSGDDTCRGDEFCTSNEPKTWWEFPEPPLEPADINFYVLGNRMALLRIAEELGKPESIREELRRAIVCQRQAIENILWDPDSHRYCDVTERGHRKSNVPDVQNITVPLFGGVLEAERAQEIAGSLFDPELFATPLPLPSCPINYSGLNGKPGFRPTGYWRGLSWGLMYYEAIWGLYRNGLRDEAVFLLRKIMEAEKASRIPAAENFNAITGDAVGCPFMGYSSQLLHPFLSLTTGLIMEPGSRSIAFDPVALNPDWEYFSFGPFAYKPDLLLSVSWSRSGGYRVSVNAQEFHFNSPTAFRLERDGETWKLDPASVHPVRTLEQEPVAAGWESGLLRVRNVDNIRRRGKVRFRKMLLDSGLFPAGEAEFSLEPDADIILTPEQPPETERGKAWLMAEIRVDGYPFGFSVGCAW